jgi:hypothetical protein
MKNLVNFFFTAGVARWIWEVHRDHLDGGDGGTPAGGSTSMRAA